MAATTACAHCGAPVAGDGAYCCAGCAAARAFIEGAGLAAFYARRVVDPDHALTPDREARDFAPHVRTGADGIARLDLLLDGLNCAACLWLIESVLARRPGLIQARVNMTQRRLRLAWRGEAAMANAFAGDVARLGFKLAPFDPGEATAVDDAEARDLTRSLAVAGFAAGNIMLLSVAIWAGHVQGMGEATRDLMHWLSALIGLPAIAYAGRPFFRSALAALAGGRTNMDVPISIGVIMAGLVSLSETMRGGPHAYFDSAVTLLFFLLIGRLLDRRARGRARAAALQLVALARRPVTVVSEAGTRVCPAHAVVAGERVLVAMGERIGVDGVVRAGESALDQSLVTGESLPVPATVGTPVFAGTLNLTSPLTIEARATGEATLLAEIARLMDAAEQGRGRYVALADRVARAYAPVVHLAALLTFLGWALGVGIGWQPAMMNAVAVLIITCPCALALAVPAVQVLATGRLMRAGVLVKSPTALERLARADTVVFDKTGTLTLGRPSLVGAVDPEALRRAAALAKSSRHPLARAMATACPGAPAHDGAREHPGLGLSAVTPEGEIRLGSAAFVGAPAGAGGPELWLREADGRMTRFEFADRPRPDALETVAALQRAGYHIALLSGDRADVVGDVARALRIADWSAAVDPAAKLARLQALRAEGRSVVMVGDGLNDAPALAAAQASISPASAADVTQTAADVVFQGDRLAPVVATLALARRAERLAAQNLALALAYNVLAVPLAVMGFVTPLIAAVAMSTSSILVVANAGRLSR